ncbi:MAG: polysaccharide biosynthesis protein [Lachnospiraceae bacterium]|nr:polysaccharide biosynthesis protein [Lachnospiraceae bacterium]
MENKKKSGFLLQGGILAAAGLFTRFIGMLYRIPLERVVGREGMGYYSNAYEIYNIALLISCYSVPVAVSKVIADKDGKGEYVNASRYFKYALLISSSIGLVVSALVFFLAPQIAGIFEYPSSILPLRVLAPTIFVFSFMGVFRGFFQGKRTMVPTAISQIVEQIFNAIVSVWAAYLLVNSVTETTQKASRGAAGGTAGTLSGAICGLLLLLFLFIKQRKSNKKLILSDTTGAVDSAGAICKTIILTMIPIVLSQTIYQISGIIDSYMFSNAMVNKGFDERTRSIFWDAYSNRYKWMYNVPVAIASAFGVTIVPTLSACLGRRDIDGIKTRIASAVKVNMLVAFPAAAGLGFLSKPILLLMFNHADDTLGPELLTIGCSAVVFFALSTLTNGVLQGINKMRKPVIHALISLVIHIFVIQVLLWFLDMGVKGMVIGNMLYGLCVCIFNWISIKKALNYKQEVIKTFIMPCICSLIMGGVAYLLYWFLCNEIYNHVIMVVPVVFFAIILYGVLIVITRTVTKEELKTMPMGGKIVKLFTKIHLLK